MYIIYRFIIFPAYAICIIRVFKQFNILDPNFVEYRKVAIRCVPDFAAPAPTYTNYTYKKKKNAMNYLHETIFTMRTYTMLSDVNVTAKSEAKHLQNKSYKSVPT